MADSGAVFIGMQGWIKIGRHSTPAAKSNRESQSRSPLWRPAVLGNIQPTVYESASLKFPIKYFFLLIHSIFYVYEK